MNPEFPCDSPTQVDSVPTRTWTQGKAARPLDIWDSMGSQWRHRLSLSVSHKPTNMLTHLQRSDKHTVLASSSVQMVGNLHPS